MFHPDQETGKSNLFVDFVVLPQRICHMGIYLAFLHWKIEFVEKDIKLAVSRSVWLLPYLFCCDKWNLVINEGLFAEDRQLIVCIKFVSFLTSDMASKTIPDMSSNKSLHRITRCHVWNGFWRHVWRQKAEMTYTCNQLPNYGKQGFKSGIIIFKRNIFCIVRCYANCNS